MSNLLGTLVVKMALDAAEFRGGLDSAAGTLQSAGARMQQIGGGLTMGLTMPLVGAGAAALAFANDYNSSLANIGSLGVPTERLEEFRGAIQEMAVEVGKMPADLSAGMYQIVSAFGDTSDSLTILDINARAAAAGLATTLESINLTSAVTKGYGDTSAAAVQHAADLAFETVKLGQTTFPELAASIGLVVPLAASLGVAQEELFGVMATGTGVTGTASQVATQLRGVLQSLMAPTKGMEGLLADMGYASGEAMLQQLGLQETINAIVEAAERSGQPLQDFIGSIEGQTLALALAGPQADVFGQKLLAMTDVSGAVDEAFLAQTDGVNATGFAMAQAAAQGAVLAQKLGEGIAPAVLKLIEMAEPLVDWLIEMADQFANADAQTQGWIVGIGAVIAAAGPVLGILGTLVSTIGTVIGAFGGASAIASAMGAALAALGGPVTLVIAALAGLVVAWNTDFLGMRTTIEGWMGDIGAAWPGFVEGLGQAWDDGVAWMQDAWADTASNLQTAWGEFMDWLPQDAEEMSVRTQEVFAAMGAGIEQAFSAASTLASNVWSKFAEWLGVDVETLNQITVQAMKQTAEQITDGLAGAIQIWNSFTDGLRDAWQGALDALRSAWEGFAGWIVGAVQGVGDTIGGIWEQATSLFGGLWPGGEDGAAGGSAGGGGGGVGSGISIVITQYFYGSADAPVVRGASRDGLLDALRQAGVR